MVVMTPRETWTDERLDDLNKKVDDGFAKVDQRFAEAKAEAAERFDRLEAQMRQMEGRFHNLNMTLIGGFFVMIAALIGLIATQI
jgi:flagellar capping protein FliD